MKWWPLGAAVAAWALVIGAGIAWGWWAAPLVAAAEVGGYLVGRAEGERERRRRDRLRIPNAPSSNVPGTATVGVVGDPRLRRVVSLEEGEGGPVVPFASPDANRFLVGSFGMDIAVLGLGLQFSRDDAQNLGVHLLALSFDNLDDAGRALARVMV